MSKIIKIAEEIISIGNEDGGILEVRLSDCTFIPNIGDEVKVFSNESKFIVSKVEVKPVVTETIQDKIHINIVNKNNTLEADGSYPYTVQRGKVINKTTYCLLALLLGGFGIHKFYAGKTALGLLYLLFCWTYIPAFVSLLEFIIGLTKRADAQGNIVV